jgi:hypothetical protein
MINIYDYNEPGERRYRQAKLEREQSTPAYEAERLRHLAQTERFAISSHDNPVQSEAVEHDHEEDDTPTPVYGKWETLYKHIQEVGLVAFAKQDDQSPFATTLTVAGLLGSDKVNAQLRDEFGDTPYAAPKVDRKTGLCGGGDAWPTCCCGHRFMEWLEGRVMDETR